MSFKNTLKSNQAQSNIEYLATCMVISAVLLFGSSPLLLDRARTVFTDTSDRVMANNFQADVPGYDGPVDPDDPNIPDDPDDNHTGLWLAPGNYSGEFRKNDDGTVAMQALADENGNLVYKPGMDNLIPEEHRQEAEETINTANAQLTQSCATLSAGYYTFDYHVAGDGTATVTAVYDAAGNLVYGG